MHLVQGRGLRIVRLVLGSTLQIAEPDFNGAARDFTPPVRWIFLQDFYDPGILDVQFRHFEYPILNFDFRHEFFSFFQIISIAVGLRYANPHRVLLILKDLA